MNWQLLDYAKDAEDTASGLHVFLGEIPQYRKDITGDIAELFAISSSLHELHEALHPSRFGRYQGQILKDLEICLPSLGHTLDDVRDMFSKKKMKRRTAPGAFPGTPPYAELWIDSLAELKGQGISLPIRLQLYRSYLQGMNDTLQGKEDADDVHSIRTRLSKLLRKQEPKQEPLESYFNRLSVHGSGHGHAQTPKPPPPKVRRPSIHSHATYPTPYPTSGYDHVQQPPLMSGYNHVPPPPPTTGYEHAPPPLRPTSGYGYVQPPRPTSGYYDDYSPPPPRPASVYDHSPPQRPASGWGHVPPPRPTSGFAYVHPPQPPPPPPRPHAAPMWGGIGEVPFVPPPVPEIPTSPTYSSTSSHSYSNQSTDSGEPVAHWGMKIFDGRHTSTPYNILGDPTKCLGREEPNVLELLLTDGFERVLELPFEAASVKVSLFWRSKDHRARILFSTKKAGHPVWYCLPLTGLTIIRSEDCLQLCRVNRRDGKLDLWARLRFVQHERMVLFFGTAVAMKRQDEHGIAKGIAEGLEDLFNPDNEEEMLFSGEITDTKYLHAFRVFRDEASGCVRFEASARRGPRKSIPIWTAFVTQYIGHRSWMKLAGPATIQFRELHPYIFNEVYRLPKGRTNKYQLTFSKQEDARTLMDIFHRIRPVRR